MLYDFHTHTYMSDGVLGFAELARRCQKLGYNGLTIADHCDSANLEITVKQTVLFCQRASGHYGSMILLPGCEITHSPPDLIPSLVEKARESGAKMVLVHGETIVEPVIPGTNKAAIKAGADVLAHPGLIETEDAALAAESGTFLEISGRKGHCYTNGHVAKIARETGASISFGSDGHQPGDYPAPEQANRILKGAGLDDSEIENTFAAMAKTFAKLR